MDVIQSLPEIGSGDVGRFDQRNTMFSRPRDLERSDAAMLEIGKKHYGVRHFKDDEGYTLLDWAFSMGSWYLERWWGFGNMVGDEGLYEWFPSTEEIAKRDRIPAGEKWEVCDPAEMTKIVKKAALYMGASSVGICKLDQRWIYSHRFDPRTLEHSAIDNIPDRFQFAIVMLHEMDYTLMRTAPAYGENAATGRGYSMMAFMASSVAHFIRDLGYEAIPCGNDTTLSIPMAIDAGLGELGRNGLLIAPGFGPRVRISKVITSLPLVADRPVKIGVRQMCEACGKCVKACPGQAISPDAPTAEGPTLSNNHGITNGISIRKSVSGFGYATRETAPIASGYAFSTSPTPFYIIWYAGMLKNYPCSTACTFGRMIYVATEKGRK
jgi:ferredoxin